MASNNWNRFPLHDYPGGAANSGGAITTDIASQVMGWRSYTLCSATTGTSYGARFQHYVTGAAGSGAAVRAYALVKGVSAATLYGLEATAEIMSTASSGVSGQAAAVRAVMSVQGTSSGTNAAIVPEFNVASGKAPGNLDAFIRPASTGSGTACKNLLSMAAPGAKDSGAMFLARHADAAATHGIQMVDANGVSYWIMVTSDTPAD